MTPDFYAKTIPEPNTGCLFWTGAMLKSGYGKVVRAQRFLRAHRLSWEIANGRPIPPGMLVRHRCDTPLCVNPDHLELGTDVENSADKVSRRRQRNPIADAERARTHCRKGHGYTAENTYLDKKGRRVCRACGADSARRRRAGVDVDHPRAELTITPLMP